MISRFSSRIDASLRSNSARATEPISRNSRCRPSGRAIGDASARRADARRYPSSTIFSNKGMPRRRYAHQHAAFGKIGGLTADETGRGFQVDADLARQTIVAPAVAGLALAEENRHPHLELFGERNDVAAVLLHRSAVCVRSGGRSADLGGALRHGVGKAQRLVGVARDVRSGARFAGSRRSRSRQKAAA